MLDFNPEEPGLPAGPPSHLLLKSLKITIPAGHLSYARRLVHLCGTVRHCGIINQSHELNQYGGALLAIIRKVNPLLFSDHNKQVSRLSAINTLTG